jgi:hypothetical protein
METGLSRKVTFFIILLMIGPVMAGERNYNFEIITMFAPNTVILPKDQISASIIDVEFNPPIIKQILLDKSAQSISLAFPNADPADSVLPVRINTKRFIKRVPIDLVYIITVSDSTLETN